MNRGRDSDQHRVQFLVCVLLMFFIATAKSLLPDGEVPERSNGAVSKTVVLLAGDRGFESLPLRQYT